MSRNEVTPGERGATMIVVLGVLSVALLLGIALLSSTEVQLRTVQGRRDAAEARTVAGSAVSELLWRLGRVTGPGVPAPPRVWVNGLLDYDARIWSDAARLLANGRDDDADGVVDEPDELNLVRDWSVAVMLAPTTGALPALPDLAVLQSLASSIGLVTSLLNTRLYVPTIQPLAGLEGYST